MPDVDVLDTTNGHHEEPDVLSPLDDTLSPHGISTSDAAGESTDETDPPVEHVEEETKDEPPAQKVPSKLVTKPSATVVKKVREIVPFARRFVMSRNKLKLTVHSIRLSPPDPSGSVIAYPLPGF